MGKRTESIAVREYVDLRFAELERRIDLGGDDMERRLGEMNKFREQLREQAGSFLTTDKYEVRHENLTERHNNDVQRLESRLNNLTWKVVAVSATTTLLVSVVLVLLSGALKL